MTPTQQALLHIGADIFKGQPKEKVNQFLEDADIYIQSKTQKAMPHCYNCDSPMGKDKFGLKCSECSARRPDGIEGK